jgi:hypothetical protein
VRRQIATCFLFLSTTAGAAQPADAPADKLVEGRAIQAVIWGMPAVNYDLMLQQMLAKVGGRENEIVYWSRLPTWKNQTLTPNPDAVYSMAFFNTRDVGPVVLDIPPADNGSITGNIDNAWQVALEDAGPAGADKGAGGKYLILPPGFTGTLPDGYIPLWSDTYGGYALLRSTPKSGSDSDVENAVAYVRRVRLYPLSQAANPPETRFVDAIDVLYDSTIPYDLNYFEALNRVIQREPWLDRDRVMIDSLRSIGGRFRSRRGPGHHHAARLWKALHVDAGDRSGRVHVTRRLQAGHLHAQQVPSLHALRLRGVADAGQPGHAG